MTKGMKYLIITGIVAVLVIVFGIYFLFLDHGSTNKATASNGCVAHQFGLGGSGNCVSDIQTLINFIETDGLTMCPFDGSGTLQINGNFDSPTQEQVKVFQAWVNCYNKQEGIPSTLATNGLVNSSTWSELCTYGYQYPKQSNSSTSPFLKQSIAAGKNAGC